MKRANTTKKSSKPPTGIDWSAFDAMTPAQRTAAALADLDAQPLRPEAFKRLKRLPRVKTLRRALKLSQEEFALIFEIPVGTVRDWEQRRKEPDTAARAYLRVIAADPDHVRKALQARYIERISYHQAELKKALQTLRNRQVSTSTESMVIPFPFKTHAKSTA
jgi:putative transcriptional regulator